MFSAFVNAFKIKELRDRILFTAGLIVLCRVAANIPCPGIDTANLQYYFDTTMTAESAGGQFMGMLDLFSGGALQQFAIGALGIMPYISASIIMQLLTPVVPSLEKLQREGEVGRNKINQYTRYLTIIICIVQGAMAAVAMANPSNLGLPSPEAGRDLVANPGTGFVLMSVCVLTAGTMILVWFGERITEKGLGNGVSIIITINIIERLPQSIMSLYEMLVSGVAGSNKFSYVHVLLLLIVFAVVTAATVMLTQGQRRIPIQMARSIMGGGQGQRSTYIPLKVNFAGVMPIIFAGAILIFPGAILRAVPSETCQRLSVYFNHDTYTYMICYGVLIMIFSYFWVANMFNPLQVSDNLKKEGAYIPGIRPGAPTSEFLDYSMTRVTFAGAVFLTALAVFPMLLYKWFQIPYDVASFFGGTSLLIIVGVTIDTLSQLESFLVMKNYDGFLKRGRLKGRRG
ncbi:MAG: preprotein translocase subunit SecY [Lentisphaeria bacterium]|nr:preprotein translocase subunit SecY [Lentisphaeria bacterium]